MYLAYTYYLRNTITNEFYYGSRSGNIKSKRSSIEDFWIHYFTSSKHIKQLIKDYGKNSFEYKIIYEGEYNDCYWAEQSIIKENIKNPLCLNRYYIDRELNQKQFSFNGKQHNDAKKKFGKSGTANNFYNKTHTPEAIEKIKAARAKQVITDEARRNMSAGQKKRVRTAWSDEVKKKISESRKGYIQPKFTCEYCGKIIGGKTNINRHRLTHQ